jgi:Holliday junction resolvase RusA-like endonuclease
VGRNGSHQLVEDNARTKPWRAEIVAAAQQATRRAGPRQAVGVEITSTLPRPSAHYGTGANAEIVKATAPPYPVGRRTGDADKLARLVLDALQDAAVLNDDAQVVEVTSRKAWPDDETIPDTLTAPGVMIRVYPIDELDDELI